MREIRLYGSEGGGAARSPYPYQILGQMALDSRSCGNDANCELWRLQRRDEADPAL